MPTRMTLYRWMTRLRWPRSYVGKFYLIAFVCIHLPLIGLLLVFALRQPHGEPIVFAAVLGTTLLGTVLAFTLQRALLAPVRATSDALAHYVADGTLPGLPTGYPDEAGRLMTSAGEAVAHLDRLLLFRERLLQVLAHDARGPLTSIVLALESARLELDPDAPNAGFTSEMYDVIDTSTRFLLELFNNLGAMAHLAEPGPGPVAPVRPGALLATLEQLLELPARQKGVRLVVEVETQEQAPLYVNAARLEQVLLNLGRNALKFTPKGGEVRLAAYRAEAAWCFDVSDTGVGFDAGLFDALTQPFTPHVRRGTEGERGTGLGLWIARTFTELAGGTLGATSSPGKGSRFTLRFPDALTAQPPFEPSR